MVESSKHRRSVEFGCFTNHRCKHEEISPLLFHIFPGNLKQEVLQTLAFWEPKVGVFECHKKVKKCQEPSLVSTLDHSNFHYSTKKTRPFLQLAVNHPMADILLASASKLCLVCGMTSPIICLPSTSTVCLLTLAGAVLYLAKSNAWI